MGGAASASAVLEFPTEASSSSPALTVEQQLAKLPQLMTQAKASDEAVWEDLRRLALIRGDPQKTSVEESFVQIWRILDCWLKTKETGVHERQTEIHRLLEEVRKLATEVQARSEEERKKCEKLRSRLKSVRKAKEGAIEIEQRLDDFSRRLRNF